MNSSIVMSDICSDLGMQDPQKLVSSDHIKMALKAALPHQTQFIDEHDPGTYYYLLDELEITLLIELRTILDGKEVDQSSIHRANDILGKIKEADEARAKDAATVTYCFLRFYERNGEYL